MPEGLEQQGPVLARARPCDESLLERLAQVVAHRRIGGDHQGRLGQDGQGIVHQEVADVAHMGTRVLGPDRMPHAGRQPARYFRRKAVGDMPFSARKFLVKWL